MRSKLCVRVCVWYYGRQASSGRSRRRRRPDDLREVDSSGVRSAMYAWTNRRLLCTLYICMTSDRYDWNVFNSVRTKWSSGTTWLVVPGFWTEQTSAAPAAKSSPFSGADATTARGWRACSSKTRSYEWTLLPTARTSWYSLIICYLAACVLCYFSWLLSIGCSTVCKHC